MKFKQINVKKHLIKRLQQAEKEVEGGPSFLPTATLARISSVGLV
jgi:hypothetical protein